MINGTDPAIELMERSASVGSGGTRTSDCGESFIRLVVHELDVGAELALGLRFDMMAVCSCIDSFELPRHVTSLTRGGQANCEGPVAPTVRFSPRQDATSTAVRHAP